MIVGLEGKILKKEPMKLHLMVYGVVYEVHISLNCYNDIKSDSIFLHVTQIMREDAHQLFGFLDKNEQRVFDSLIKISGVGGKVAMAVCSTYMATTFAEIVSSKDINALKRVPGIGPKGAGRIMVELGGFSLESSGCTPIQAAHSEASMALESLGFKKEEVAKALQGAVGQTTGELVKIALSKLQRL